MLSYKGTLERLSSPALLAQHQGRLYAWGMDLKKLFEGKEGEIARLFKISIQAVSQWVVSGKVPPERAVLTARALGLPDTYFLSPDPTKDVNDALGNIGQDAANGRTFEGDDRKMVTKDIYEEFGRMKERLDQLEKRVVDLAAAIATDHPRKARRR